MSSTTTSSSSSLRLSWCCSFTTPVSQKTDLPSKSSLSSPHSQCSTSSKVAWRILSPGRVSPLGDITPFSSDDVTTLRTQPASLTDDVTTRRTLLASPTDDVTSHRTSSPTGDVTTLHTLPPTRSRGVAGTRKGNVTSRTMDFAGGLRSGGNAGGGNGEGLGGMGFDVRMNVKGRSGGSLVLELNSEVLTENSAVFGDLIAECRRNNVGGDGVFRIEVPEVEDLNVFQATIELMFEEDVSKRVLHIGVYRAIDVLEVAAGIKFQRGVSFCLKYIEAMPWTEEEEEKLKILFSKYKFDDAITKDICERLISLDSAESQQYLTKQLVSSITTSSDNNARTELKSLVRGLLSKSSIYLKNHHLNAEDILAVCQSCLNSLNDLLKEAAGLQPSRTSGEKVKEKPLVVRVSKQVDNLNWLLEMLLDHQIAEDFVNMWANQKELLKLHEIISPMIRYEVSRVSALIFIAMGSGKLHCKSEERSKLLKAWFRPMLMDYGWLQRCKKGLDIEVLGESMGQTLLTLPLKEQHALFMDWFNCFSKSSTACPNLSTAFQIWWRRSFLHGSETTSIESR